MLLVHELRSSLEAKKEGSMTTKKKEKLNVREKINVHAVTDGPAKGWVHTHGLAAYGYPELEIRDVPPLFYASATIILNGVADYLLNYCKKPLTAGQTMQFDSMTYLKFHEARPDDEKGYDSNHYETPVLRVSSIELPCSCCPPKAAA
jgi:hypothetical protein